MLNSYFLRRATSAALCAAALIAAACGDDPTPAQPAADSVSAADQTTADDTLTSTLADTATSDAEADTASPLPTGRCAAHPPDWSRDARVPDDRDRRDICQLGDALPGVVQEGLGYAHTWPIDVSGVLLPWRPLYNMLDPNTEDASVLGFQDVARARLGFGTTEEMFDWLGLPRADLSRPPLPGVAWPDTIRDDTPLGAGLITTPWGDALTFSCAACHTADFFGHTVIGLTNRRAQANAFFHLAGTFFPDLSPRLFQSLTGATPDEITLYRRAQDNFSAVGVVLPQTLGLDTSLAQVSLSLSRRDADPWATKNPSLESSPRPNDLSTTPADSKPAVWWTLKHKTRWLSDGSIVSGNPIFTNFLWNELGRGTDLHELSAWLDQNQAAVDALTAAAFATTPPPWTDFFGPHSVNLPAARRGQATFQAVCASCHGTYDKAWDAPDAPDASNPDNIPSLIPTTRVHYHPQTPVLDVGTDPLRAQGMATFADRLNDLVISQQMGTVVEVQSGYVPPPLDGVWMRYPYLHNQSVPSLCALLSPAADRPSTFWLGPDLDLATDYDPACVGLPTGDATPDTWKADPQRLIDTSRPGLSNQGHDAWLTSPDGQPTLSPSERADLIEFLKTL
jgi:mono/diheme cytochrome c family protein